MDETEARLIERERRWHREVPPIPPVAETRTQLAERLAAVADVRDTVFAAIDRQRDDTIELLRQMMRIESVNPSEGFEQEMASYAAGQLRALGMEPTSDSRWIPLDAGVPIVNFSMGNDSGHRPNEWCGIDDLIDNVKIYALMCLLLRR